jgi:hypothetical protein
MKNTIIRNQLLQAMGISSSISQIDVTDVSLEHLIAIKQTAQQLHQLLKEITLSIPKEQ